MEVALGKRIFHFENLWLLESDIGDIVKEGWSLGSEGNMVAKLGGCAENIQSWSKRIRTGFKEDIDECRRQLEVLRDRGDEMGVAQYKNVKDRMLNLITQEEVF